MDFSNFDFIDFGASKGGAIEFAKAKLGGTNGLGVDRDPKKIKIMEELGYNCMLGDITALDIPDNSFRFCMMSHVLEHLPDYKTCLKAIKEAVRISTDFVYIQGPFFDEDRWLAKNGFKFFWSDWIGHPYHLSAKDLRKCLKKVGYRNIDVYGHVQVKDSLDSAIHPLESPVDSLEYDSAIHPPKNEMAFEKPLYREIISLVPLKTDIDVPRVSKVRKKAELMRPPKYPFLFS